MKERPILYNATMVRAILEGRKTMTRRIVKPQPEDVWPADGQEMSLANGHVRYYAKDVTASINRGVLHYGCPGYSISGWRCPGGIPGNRLWVKETHYRWGRWVKNGFTKTGRQRWRFRISGTAPGMRGVRYFDFGVQPPRKRTELGWHKRPSIFMPRFASRIILEITNVRVERLQEITRHDAIAEGGEERNEDGAWLGPEVAFCRLWESIYGAGSWEANPWVWVVEFKRLKP